MLTDLITLKVTYQRCEIIPIAYNFESFDNAKQD